MSAKEMFEKLGYKKVEDRYYACLYEKVVEQEDYTWKHRIVFETDGKTKYVFSDKYTSMELLQAINKQIEELGWNK